MDGSGAVRQRGRRNLRGLDLSRCNTGGRMYWLALALSWSVSAILGVLLYMERQDTKAAQIMADDIAVTLQAAIWDMHQAQADMDAANGIIRRMVASHARNSLTAQLSRN